MLSPEIQKETTRPVVQGGERLLADNLHRGFRLDRFTVLPVMKRIESHGATRQVSARAMDVLLALARRPGHVLSRRRTRR